MKEIKRVKVKPRGEDAKFVGEEHSWLPETINEKNRKIKMINAMNWLNYVVDNKDNRKFLEEWIKIKRVDTSTQDLELLNKTSDRYIRPTYCYLARIHVQGFPLTDEEQQKIWEHIVESAAKSGANKEEEVVVPEKSAEPKIGVQERIAAQVDNVVGEIEEVISNLLRGKQTETDFSKIPGTEKFSAVHHKKLADAVQVLLKEYTNIKEARNSKSDNDEIQQIKESYSFVSAKNIKATVQFLEEVYATSAKLALIRKVNKLRKKRPVDKNKLVSKFKFLPKFDEFKLQSLQPVNALGVNEVWMYNTRTRKLGCYKAEFTGSLMIKGSSFIGFNTNTSVQKTLRKPEKQLAEFQSLAKNQINKWFNNIRSTEHRLNGRSNEHSLLMRII